MPRSIQILWVVMLLVISQACMLPSLSVPADAAYTPQTALLQPPPATEELSQPTASETPSTPLASPSPEPTLQRSRIALWSSAFNYGTAIPAMYTCDGQDVSPALSWTEPPPESQSFALIMEDPDSPGGTWDHWVIFNIPSTARGLSASMPTTGQLSDGSVQGTNSWGGTGYRGPCPPSGNHRYIFRLYALDILLALQQGATKSQVLQAMQGHILESAEWYGTYGE